MSTRGILIVEQATGMFTVTTACRDAYPTHMLKVLNSHFKSDDAALKLIGAGEILDILPDGSSTQPRDARPSQFFTDAEKIIEFAKGVSYDHIYLWTLHGDRWREVTPTGSSMCLTFVKE